MVDFQAGRSPHRGRGNTESTIQSAIYRCRYCATEVQASVELSADAACWFTVTAWKDLGDGSDQNAQPWVAHQKVEALNASCERYQPAPKHRGCFSEAFETPARADTTLHMSIPPFEIYDPELRLDRLYDEESGVESAVVDGQVGKPRKREKTRYMRPGFRRVKAKFRFSPSAHAAMASMCRR